MIEPEHIAFQRQLVADMNLTFHRDRLLTDFVMLDGRTSEPLDRGDVFDRHALLVLILDEAHPALNGECAGD